jgi:hypothetical protein
MRKPNYVSEKEIQAESFNWRKETMAYYMANAVGRKSWDRKGLHALVESAVDYFVAKTGFKEMPHNFATHGPYVGYNWEKKQYENLEIVEEVARFIGWLKKAAEIPELIWVIKNTQTHRGMNSPYLQLNLYTFAKRHPSPHRAGRFVRRLRKRANRILFGYGLKLSWRALGDTLEYGPRCVGKAAMFAAAKTVEQFASGSKRRKGINLNNFWRTCEGRKVNGRDFLVKARGWRDALTAPDGIRVWAEEKIQDSEYSCLTEALADAHLKLVKDVTDGVEMYVDPTSETYIHGIKVLTGWQKHRMYLISDGTGRSYHYQAYYYGSTPRAAVRAALKAWHQQKQLERAHEQMLSKLRPADRTILVYREDSYRAGNCQAGTSAFAERNGFNGRPFVPAEWLFPHLENTAVRRVLNQVANQL